MDGMHRVARAIVDGRDSVRAVRFTQAVAPDYRDCRPEDLPYSPAAPIRSWVGPRVGVGDLTLARAGDGWFIRR